MPSRFDDSAPFAESHIFELKNNGPSYTNSKTLVRIFLPKFNSLQTEIKTKDIEKECVSQTIFTLPNTTPNAKEGFEQLYCNRKENCTVFDCEIKEGWNVDEVKEITVEFDMVGSQVPKRFQISSIVRIIEEEEGMAFIFTIYFSKIFSFQDLGW